MVPSFGLFIFSVEASRQRSNMLQPFLLFVGLSLSRRELAFDINGTHWKIISQRGKIKTNPFIEKRQNCQLPGVVARDTFLLVLYFYPDNAMTI